MDHGHGHVVFYINQAVQIRSGGKKMKKFLVVMGIGFFLFGMAGAVVAADKPTQNEAKALVEKAVAFVKANGKEKAFAEFNNPQGQFVKGELYVLAQGLNGVILAHGANVKLIGQDHLQLKDATGKLFVKEMVDLVNTKGSGWVEYSWTHPQTKKVQAKMTYIQKVDDYFIGCGIYK
jgi:cytochrome c